MHMIAAKAMRWIERHVSAILDWVLRVGATRRIHTLVNTPVSGWGAARGRDTSHPQTPRVTRI